ncbi:MAG: hypothetical protein ACI8ZN_001918 [Bacteroidia bacterium]|jgi:hypothetical protein
MKHSILRSILIGLLVGLLIFTMPRLFFAFLIIGLIFKLLKGGRSRNGGWVERKMAFTDRVRSMSDEEYENFKNTRTHCSGHFYQENLKNQEV